MAERFGSFEDAWRWFERGGELVTVDEQREQLTAGRAQYLSFQAPMSDNDDALDAYDKLIDAVASLPGIVPQPPELLHITVRPAGFQVITKTRDDDVLRQDVPRMAERAARLLKDTHAFPIAIGPPAIFPDALVLEVSDDGHLEEIRRELAQVTPRARDASGEGMPHLPHISVAWFASREAAAALRGILPALRGSQPVETQVRRLELARYWFTGTGAEDEEIDLDVIRSYRLRA